MLKCLSIKCIEKIQKILLIILLCVTDDNADYYC